MALPAEQADASVTGMALRPRHLAVALAIIAVMASVLWSKAARTENIVCFSEFGETFIAHFYIRNFRLFGFDYGLVEDHATSPDRAAHPYFCTHNVNLGGLSFLAFDGLGLTSFAAKQFVVLLVFCLGLGYGFLTATLYSTTDTPAGTSMPRIGPLIEYPLRDLEVAAAIESMYLTCSARKVPLPLGRQRRGWPARDDPVAARSARVSRRGQS